ncbi:MAG: DNA methyltransferase [Halothiobacillaceae bacterium]
MLAVLTYKRDVESKDDHYLAVLEANKLSQSEVREVAQAEARELLGTKHLPFVVSTQRTFVVDVTPDIAERMLRRLAFWDLLLVQTTSVVEPGDIAIGNAWAEVDGVLAFATQSQVFEWTAYAKDDPAMCSALRSGHALEALAALSQNGVGAAVDAPLTPISRRKNEYLTHGFHKYKAKFFPRLARSLINYTCPSDDGIVLDPYCGSGTTGVEASLMGMHAVEFDLDPLSAFIADSKALLGHLDLTKFQQAVSRLPSKVAGATAMSLQATEPYRLPAFLRERNPKRLTPEVLDSVEGEGTLIKEIIQGCPDGETKALFELAFSHAMATKVSLRWMGTGDNRYALEIAKRSLYAIFIAQLHYMVRKLGSWAALRDGGIVRNYGDVDVGVSDCATLPLADSSVDAVVTSPPYLPAASGRETYLRSRAASLVALGLMSEEAIHDCETRIVGSILAMPDDLVPLPESVNELVNWMQPQRERTSKARPTAAYFERLGESLKEMKRVLKPGGYIALVVSKEHMFYEMTTRKVLRRFSMVEAISEMGTGERYGIGLELDRVQELELPKMDFAARPGSHGTYSEAIIFFRKR